jgi:pyruvate formate-lyase activating enzyme-like uncharacterized protein
MLEFDFRNGQLRRKYDGLKYALKSIEDISFELSLQRPVPLASVGDGEEEQIHKKLRASSISNEEEFSYLNKAELDEIRGRMEVYDKCRELVIKESRDVQKLSKLAVYSVIRGQLKDAAAKLEQAAVIANKIFITVDQVSFFPHLFYCSLESLFYHSGRLFDQDLSLTH